MGQSVGDLQSENRALARIKVSQDVVAEFCQRWKITELSLFGSVLREDFGRESDIDVLVSFKPGNVPGLGFVSMADELESLFGRSVDVLARSAVERSQNRLRRKEILGSAKVIYAEE